MAELYFNRAKLYFSPKLSRTHRDDLLNLHVLSGGNGYPAVAAVLKGEEEIFFEPGSNLEGLPATYSCRSTGEYNVVSVVNTPQFPFRNAVVQVFTTSNTLRVRFNVSTEEQLGIRTNEVDLVLATSVPEGEPETWSNTLALPIRCEKWVELEVDLYDRLVLSLTEDGKKRTFETPSVILRSADRYERIDRGIV